MRAVGDAGAALIAAPPPTASPLSPTPAAVLGTSGAPSASPPPIPPLGPGLYCGWYFGAPRSPANLLCRVRLPKNRSPASALRSWHGATSHRPPAHSLRRPPQPRTPG